MRHDCCDYSGRPIGGAKPKGKFSRMPEVAPRTLTLPHAVFLERATNEPPTSAAVRLGQGAFLVLRLVDLLAPDREPPTSPEVFRYQSAATERYCAELGPLGAEVAHLQGLVRNVQDVYAHQDARLITPALLAYAHYLEDDGHYVEALDVLETLLRVAERQMRDADRIATALRVGRVNRKMHRFDEAERWYMGGESGLRRSTTASRCCSPASVTPTPCSIAATSPSASGPIGVSLRTLAMVVSARRKLSQNTD